MVERSLLGQAAKAAGPLGGVSNGAGANGLYAGWTISNPDFGNGLSDGQLVYLAGSQVNLWSQFLRRDGSLPMMGNLDMGSFNVMKMSDMFLNGPATNPRNKNVSSLMPNWVFKGVMSAQSGAFIPEPLCENGGEPKIKVMMQVMQGTKSSMYFENVVGSGAFPAITTTDPDLARAQANQQLADSAAKHTLTSWADPTSGGWLVYFQDIFSQDDATTHEYCAGNPGGAACKPMKIEGKGLAELYCHYPDK
jgi:hypothetical protein